MKGAKLYHNIRKASYALITLMNSVIISYRDNINLPNVVIMAIPVAMVFHCDIVFIIACFVILFRIVASLSINKQYADTILVCILGSIRQSKLIHIDDEGTP